MGDTPSKPQASGRSRCRAGGSVWRLFRRSVVRNAGVVSPIGKYTRLLAYAARVWYLADDTVSEQSARHLWPGTIQGREQGQEQGHEEEDDDEGKGTGLGRGRGRELELEGEGGGGVMLQHLRW